MKTVGFPISHKENEFRRTILPRDVYKMKNKRNLYFEKGYGKVLGIEDSEYIELGCHICERQECLNKDILCDPKIGDGDYLEFLKEGCIIFGWIHAIQNKDITEKIIRNKLTAYAWENMFCKGRHVFWRNNELAGEAAVMHAFQCYGKMPYESKVAIIGKGNTARGAVKILNMLGAEVVQYDRRTESLLREEIGEYDVIINCILWDVMRKDHIIYKDDLNKMKKGSFIIDVSCDRNGAIETSVPTTIRNPTYLVNGILHYAVDHTPALFYKTFTENNSAVIYPYLEELVQGKCGDVLNNALIARYGEIMDKSIIQFQKR